MPGSGIAKNHGGARSWLRNIWQSGDGLLHVCADHQQSVFYPDSG